MTKAIHTTYSSLAAAVCLVIAMLFAGCVPSPREAFKTRLAAADSVGTARPDSALRLLQGMEGAVARQSEFVRNRYAVVKMCCEANVAAGRPLPFATDSCLVVCRYFRWHGNIGHRLQAYRLAADMLLRAGREAEALQWLDDACREMEGEDVDPQVACRFHLGKAHILCGTPSTLAFAYDEYATALRRAKASGDRRLVAGVSAEMKNAAHRLALEGHKDVALKALDIYTGKGGLSHSGLRLLASLAAVLAVALAGYVVYLLWCIRKKKNEEFAVNFRNRMYVEQIQGEIVQLNKVIKRLRQMLQDEKHANTDSFKTITEQQWRLGKLSERMHVIDQKERQRHNAAVQQSLQQSSIVQLLHNMALHPLRNVLPTDEHWKILEAAVSEQSPDFYAVMNHNVTLRPEEYRVCMLIKAQFKMSEICYLLGMGSSKLTNLRTRLLSKVFGREGGAKDFDRAVNDASFGA